MRRSRLPPRSAAAARGGISLPAPQHAASSPSGTLFIVSLPIGDPDDITLRALRVLRAVSLIVAENARLARSLFALYPVGTETLSLRTRHGLPARMAALTFLRAGRDVALVADSGTPTILDPGLGLIQEAIKAGHRVTAVPGATAFLAALVLSGLSPAPFSFLGYPPRGSAERALFFAHLAASRQTMALYESAGSLRSTLLALRAHCEHSRNIVVACDLTHPTERVFRGTLSQAVSAFADIKSGGAYTLVLSGRADSSDAS